MTAQARRFGKWCREYFSTSLPGAPPEGDPGADPAPESDDGPVPPDAFTAETSVVE
jgi:hypothetical protein